MWKIPNIKEARIHFRLKKLSVLFNEHPNSINETYGQHFRYALKMVARLFWIALNLTCHGVFPFSRVSYARDQILNISNNLLIRNPPSATSVRVNLSAGLQRISDTIGRTPMIELRDISPDPQVRVYAKCEMFNPSFSIKDRIVLEMIKALEESGDLKPHGTVVEASSGNTGCSVAMLAACFHYKAIICVPAKTSIEKITMMQAFGARVLISPPNVTKSSPEHYSNRAKKIQKETPHSVLLNQYENPINPFTHYQQTAREIWDSLEGAIDCVIVCSSSGGTISGIGKYFKERNPTIKIVMPDPYGSIYYHYFKTKTEDRTQHHSYQVEGIGKDYICGTMDFSVIDDVVQVSDEDAFERARWLAKSQGILAGGSSGAALHVAGICARRYQQEKRPANIVVLLPDSGFKYLSTFYSEIETTSRRVESEE